MRIFVLGTGRSGTTTFYHAASHATNYTAAHETKAGRHVDDFWSYPDNHIEVHPPLPFSGPALRRRYPNARFVHIIRERSACCSSIASPTNEGWLRQFCGTFLQFDTKTIRNLAFRRKTLLQVAAIYYDATNDAIRAALPDAFKFRLEKWREDWPDVWAFMNCEGDYQSSLKEWERKYNPREKRGRDNWVPA